MPVGMTYEHGLELLSSDPESLKLIKNHLKGMQKQ